MNPFINCRGDGVLGDRFLSWLSYEFVLASSYVGKRATTHQAHPQVCPLENHTINYVRRSLSLLCSASLIADRAFWGWCTSFHLFASLRKRYRIGAAKGCFSVCWTHWTFSPAQVTNRLFAFLEVEAFFLNVCPWISLVRCCTRTKVACNISAKQRRWNALTSEQMRNVSSFLLLLCCCRGFRCLILFQFHVLSNAREIIALAVDRRCTFLLPAVFSLHSLPSPFSSVVEWPSREPLVEIKFFVSYLIPPSIRTVPLTMRRMVKHHRKII